MTSAAPLPGSPLLDQLQALLDEDAQRAAAEAAVLAFVRLELERIRSPAKRPRKSRDGKRRWLLVEGGRELLRAVRSNALTAEDEQLLRDTPRPKTRADCLPGGCNEARPCVWLSCAHHLALQVFTDEQGRSRSLRVLDDSWMTDGLPTCSLDVADEGVHDNERVAQLTGYSRQGIQYAELKLMPRLREDLEAEGVDEEWIEAAIAGRQTRHALDVDL